jgi:phosphoribosylformylglycinamidine (FGAM) synthase PurS component
MIYCVEVSIRPGFPDARGLGLLGQVEALGVGGVQSLAVADLYFVAGELDDDAVQRVVDLLLHDPVVEEAQWQRLEALERTAMPPDMWSVEVTLLPGVTDSVAESLLAGARMIGVHGLRQAATGRRYTLTGDLAVGDVERIARGLLANEVIQRYHVNELAAPPFVEDVKRESWGVPGDVAAVEVIALREADDAGLLAISQARRLSLDLAEMQAIQGYYQAEDREPTDVELEMLAQTWSEHCVHKTFKAVIEYSGPAAGSVGDWEPSRRDRPEQVERIDGLLKTYIRAATERAAKPWVRSAFVDNAGIVAFRRAVRPGLQGRDPQPPLGAGALRRGQHRRGRRGARRDRRQRPAHCQHRRALLRPGRPALGAAAGRRAAPAAHRRRRRGRHRGLRQQDGHPHGQRRDLLPTKATPPTRWSTAAAWACCRTARTAPSRRPATCRGHRRPHRPRRPARRDLLLHGDDHETGAIAGSAVQIGHPIHEKQVLEAVCWPATRGCTAPSPTAARAGSPRRSARWGASGARSSTWSACR